MTISVRTHLTGLASNLGWLLAPVIVYQGKKLCRRIVRLPEAGGARSGACAGQGSRIGWLVIGDSTAAGVGADSQTDALGQRGATVLAARTGRPVHWQVIGRNGRRIADVRKTLKAVLPEAGVDVVVIAVGVNDVTRWTSGRQFRRQMQGLLDEIARRFDEPLVLFSGLPPVHRFPDLPAPLRQAIGLRAHFIDRVLRESVTVRHNVRYVPLRFDDDPALFCADGFHPGVDAYHLWADELVAQAMASGRLAT